ncbi:MAG: hypothetical protein M3Z20_11385 [Chloroflexota bacterium]|nr:hypothetical protein [Chloroflexota bacterium]
MIPALLLAGVLIGLLPQPWFVVGIPISAAAWTILLAISKPGPSMDAASMFGDFAIAAINAALAVFVTRKIVHLVQALRV